jgi:hypothetical protein
MQRLGAAPAGLGSVEAVAAGDEAVGAGEVPGRGVGDQLAQAQGAGGALTHADQALLEAMAPVLPEDADSASVRT